MSVGTADNHAAPMPSNDGTVARALHDLEEKLKAWTAAAAAVNESIAAKAAPNGESSAPLESKQTNENPVPSELSRQKATSRLREPEPIPQPAPVTNKASKLPVDGRTEKTTASTPVAAKPSPLPEQSVKDDETLLAGLNPERAEAIRARHAYFKGRKSIGELIQEFEDEADDEESLLMSLDPEFAKAIRVKYRLYNGRKTLREVIAEVEASQPKQLPADKKTWWRR